MNKSNYFYIFIIWFSWILWGLINYLYHPLMLQFMTIEDFWIFWTLTWVFNILWVLTTWFLLFLNKEFSKNLENWEKIKSIYFDTLKIFFLIWVFAFWIFAIFSPVIWKFLNIEDYFLIILLWITIISSFLWITINWYLRANKSFFILWIWNILWPIIKLFFWVLFVFLWFKIYWAIFWFLLSSFFSVLFLFYFWYKDLKNISYKSDFKWLFKNFSENKIEILNFFLVSLFLAILMNFDTILARNIFSETEAWIYAWISVLWKFLLFLLMSVETVYFGQIMEYKREKLPFHLLRNPTILMIILWFFAIIFNYFFWEFILKILKKEFIEFKNIYILILLYYWALAFINFFAKIMIWWKNYKINIFLLIYIILFIFILYTFWNTLFNYSLIFAIFWIIFTIILAIIFFYSYKWKK